MRDVIFFFSSHRWEKLVKEGGDMAAIDRLVRRFSTPLQASQVDTNVIKAEFSDMIAYGVQYIALSTLDYHSVWWRLSIPQARLNGPMHWLLQNFYFYYTPEGWPTWSIALVSS